MGKSKKPKIKKKEMPACPPEIIKQFTDHGFEADWVQGEYEIFTTNYPSGKAKKAELITRLTTAAAERLPNCDAANVANTLYPAFDPEDKGEVDFIVLQKEWLSSMLLIFKFEPSYSFHLSMKTKAEK